MTIKSNLLFLNSGLESGVPASTIKLTPSFAYKLRANDETHYLGSNAMNEDIIRIRSAFYHEGTSTIWNHPNAGTNVDLSGVQQGFQGSDSGAGGYNTTGAAGSTNPSNTYLEWRTSSVVNAFDTVGSDADREGGYYCGTQISAINVKNVNLTNYRDYSNNNTGTGGGYRAVIWQELRSTTGAANNPLSWTAYPTQTTGGKGWRTTFNPATRPTKDIILLTNSSNSFSVVSSPM